MRIAFMSWRDLANDLAGGSELWVDRLAVRLQAMGHEAVHLCGGPVGVRPYPVVDLGGTYGQYLQAPIAHYRHVRDWDLLVDIENGLPYFSPLWRRKPILGFVHHVHSDQWIQRFPPPVAALGRLVEERAMPRVYRRVPFVAVSESTAVALGRIGVDRERISVINPGVDLPDLPPIPRSPTPLFVCAGRLMPHKRIDLLLRAWERVRPRTGGELVVMGDGPEREALEALAGEGVVFAGRVDEDEKWRTLARAWTLIHPAQHEGWGIVIIEAAVVGTPSIGFDVPGVRDAIQNGETGVLVADEDELVEQWVALTLDESRRTALAEGARRHGSQFGWDAVTAKFAAIAEAAIGQGAAR